MAPLAVVEHLNPLEDQITRVSAVPLCLMEIQFHLEGGEKALHRGVVPAFSLSTHTLERLEALQGLSILTAGVLNSRLEQNGTRMGPARWSEWWRIPCPG